MKGNLTVEASYIFPFCFAVIGIVCFLGVFIYNKTVLKMTGYECIFQALEESQEAGLEESLEKLAQETARKRILAVRELDVSVKNTAFQIMVNYRGIQNLLNIPLEVTVVYEKTFPERNLRLTKGT